MDNKIDCCVIGDAMVDIVFPTTNSKDLDYILHGGAISTKSTISAGGTANIAVNLAQLGGKSAFIGKIGNDCFGNFFKNNLNINHVRNSLAISKSHKTGIVFSIILPNKERFFIVDRGANAYLQINEVDIGFCLNTQYLYVSGYSFQDTKTYQTIKTIIKEAAGKVDIIFNPAAPNIAKRYKDKFMDLIKNYIDILILNEKEGDELIIGGDVIEELIPHVKSIALTKSEVGSIIATQSNIYKIKAYPADVVDTTGAGDAYAAGFIYGLTKGWSMDMIGDFASKIAGIAVSKKGARCNFHKLIKNKRLY